MGKRIIVKTAVGILAFGAWLAIGYLAEAQSTVAARAEAAPAPRAIQCTAALELMAQAAPSWSSQAAAQEARKIWYQAAKRVALVAGRPVAQEINQEMTLIAEAAVDRPDALSTLAVACLADAPVSAQ